MSNLLAARAQMGTSLAFHIIFASLGIGLPLLLCIAEGLALRRKDSGWMTLTRRWTKAFALLFAIGAVSGSSASTCMGGSASPRVRTGSARFLCGSVARRPRGLSSAQIPG